MPKSVLASADATFTLSEGDDSVLVLRWIAGPAAVVLEFTPECNAGVLLLGSIIVYWRELQGRFRESLGKILERLNEVILLVLCVVCSVRFDYGLWVMAFTKAHNPDCTLL